MNENDTIEIRCSVNYSGNWAPVMKWQQDGGPVITDGRDVNSTVPYKSVTYSLTVRATRDMNGRKFYCTTYFSADNKPTTNSAGNVPNFNSTWISPAVSFWRKLLSLYTGNHSYCSNCIYKWQICSKI